MKFYKLMYDYKNDKNYINCKIIEKGIIDEYLVSEGRYITEWPEILFGYDASEGKQKTDYIANLYRWLIVSDKFYSLINDLFPDLNVQFLPVKMFEIKEKDCEESYKVLNILDVVDALDLEQSIYDVFELGDEKIYSVSKYALKKDAVKGKDIFRLKDDTIPIFVSESIKTMIENNNLKGFDFLEVPVF